MATTTAKIKLPQSHPPLARDAHGNLLAVPDGTTAWRICRKTSGRPREIRNPDDQLVRFQLGITTDALVDLCGAGVYRVYALDEVGAQIGDEHVAKWDLTPGARELRNASSTDGPPQPPRPTGGGGNLGEFRSVIETMTNAMTQLMRTNSDALRVVTDSQVELARMIANAKGLPRNAAFAPALLPARTHDDETDDDDPEEFDEESRPRSAIDLLMPFAEKAAEMFPGLVMGKVAQNTQAQTPVLPSANGPSAADDDLANRPMFEARDLVDLEYAKRKGDAKRAAKRGTQNAAASPASVAPLPARIMSDPALVQLLMQVKLLLSIDEVEALMSLMSRTSEEQQAQFVEMIKQLPVDQAADFCRDVIGAASQSSASNASQER